MKESWKTIKGFGFYKVSSSGRVKSLDRLVFNGKVKHLREGQILKPGVSKEGYCIVVLRRNNKSYTKYVHRLVSKAFIKNPKRKKTVNHKDGDRSNNNLENLEWMSYSENNKHAFDHLGRIPTWKNKKGALHHSSKSVSKYNLSGEFIEKYGSAAEASRKNNSSPGCISNMCNGNALTVKGFIYKYD